MVVEAVRAIELLKQDVEYFLHRATNVVEAVRVRAMELLKLQVQREWTNLLIEFVEAEGAMELLKH